MCGTGAEYSHPVLPVLPTREEGRPAPRRARPARRAHRCLVSREGCWHGRYQQRAGRQRGEGPVEEEGELRAGSPFVEGGRSQREHQRGQEEDAAEGQRVAEPRGEGQLEHLPAGKLAEAAAVGEAAELDHERDECLLPHQGASGLGEEHREQQGRGVRGGRGREREGPAHEEGGEGEQEEPEAGTGRQEGV